MEVPTSEFRALTEQAAAAAEERRVLLRTIAWLTGQAPDAAAARPVLRLIRGGSGR